MNVYNYTRAIAGTGNTKLLSGLGSLLGNIPVIGGLFGGGSSTTGGQSTAGPVQAQAPMPDWIKYSLIGIGVLVVLKMFRIIR